MWHSVLKKTHSIGGTLPWQSWASCKNLWSLEWTIKSVLPCNWIDDPFTMSKHIDSLPKTVDIAPCYQEWPWANIRRTLPVVDNRQDWVRGTRSDLWLCSEFAIKVRICYLYSVRLYKVHVIWKVVAVDGFIDGNRDWIMIQQDM